MVVLYCQCVSVSGYGGIILQNRHGITDDGTEEEK